MDKNTKRKVAAGAAAALAVAGGGVADRRNADRLSEGGEPGCRRRRGEAARDRAEQVECRAPEGSRGPCRRGGRRRPDHEGRRRPDEGRNRVRRAAVLLRQADTTNAAASASRITDPGSRERPPTSASPRSSSGRSSSPARPWRSRDGARKDGRRAGSGALRRDEEASRRRRGRGKADAVAGGHHPRRAEVAPHRPRERDASAFRPRRRDARLPRLPRLPRPTTAAGVQGADRVRPWSRGSNLPAAARRRPSGH